VIFGMVYGGGGLAERLTARKFPFPVVYGPEQHDRDAFDTTIVFQRDESVNDTIGSPQGQQRNPRKHYTRKLAVVATIYAKSTEPNAMIGDHEWLCEQLVDAVTVALDEWCSEAKAGEPEYGEMRYLRREEMGKLETWPGRAYVVRFKIGRGVMARDYLGAAQPQGTMSGFSNTTQVHRTAAPAGELPATGCQTPPTP
jgi:hypothetical protein